VSAAVELLARRVPQWPHARAARRGAALGRWLWRLDRRHRQVAEANLALAFPDLPSRWHRDTARASYEQMGRTAMEMLWSPRLASTPLDSIALDDQVGRLLEAVRSGTGALLVSAHFGNWELIAVALAQLGVPLVSVARPLDDPGLERILLRLRTRTGAEVLPKQNAVRGALRALAEGKVVAVLNDQNTLRREAVFVPFFGRLAATSPLVAHLHLRSGAPIFPGFAVPDGERYRVRIEPQLDAVAGARSEAVVEITAAITRTIEAQVRQQPGAWLWMHDRWRERP
jgi:KDO2-lipid IV(A) lauroyltransferase